MERLVFLSNVEPNNKDFVWEGLPNLSSPEILNISLTEQISLEMVCIELYVNGFKSQEPGKNLIVSTVENELENFLDHELELKESCIIGNSLVFIHYEHQGYIKVSQLPRQDWPRTIRVKVVE